MRYLFITSFNTAKHWDIFVRGTLTSFMDHLPSEDCKIVAYTDGPKLVELDTIIFNPVENIQLENLSEWNHFMEKFKGVKPPPNVPDGHKFRFKFRPFFSKVCAIKDAFERFHDEFDYLVWIDADCLLTKDITKEDLESFVTAKFEPFEEDLVDLAWMDRPNEVLMEDTLKGWGTPDTGVVFFRNNSFTGAYIRDVFYTYTTGMFLEMLEWHDAFIWKAILRYWRDDLLVKNLALNPHLSDPILGSPLSEFITHMKGPLKMDPKINPQISGGNPKEPSKDTLKEAREFYEKRAKQGGRH